MQSKKDRETFIKAVLWTNTLLRKSALKDIITEHVHIKEDNPS
jgi:hypothetical protein